jgi:hypothetical protein
MRPTPGLATLWATADAAPLKSDISAGRPKSAIGTIHQNWAISTNIASLVQYRLGT